MDKQARRDAYMAKLRDPRWQKKRLEIMQRDEFTCQYCYDKQSTLNVHHNWYEPGRDPWEYPDDALVTLCETCHENESQCRAGEEQTLLLTLRRIGMSHSDIHGLTGALRTFEDRPWFAEKNSWAIDIFLSYFDHFRDEIIEWQMERMRAEGTNTQESGDK